MAHTPFTKVNWANGAGGGTPESAANLANDENRIALLDAFFEHFGGTDGTFGAPPGVTSWLRLASGVAGWRTKAQTLADLDLEIGTDVQAQNALLTAIAGLSPLAADRIIYTTGSNAVAAQAFTALARSLVGSSTTTAMRAVLELASMALQASNSVSITGGVISGLSSLAVSGAVTCTGNLSVGGAGRSPAYTLTDQTTLAPDANESNNFVVTVAGNRTMGAVANALEGTVFNFLIKKSGTGRTITWNAAYKFPGGVKAQLSAGSNPDLFSFYYDGTAFWPAGKNLS